MMLNAAETKTTRDEMSAYWSEHASSASVESMMLDDNAASITASDMEEVINMLPSYEDTAVCEIGAGIGRFTGRLITEKKVRSLHVSDFMESYIEANRAAHGHHAGTSFACEDVTMQDFGVERYDHVFSNWLFMYLDDAETTAVFQRIFDSLKPGGTFFMRESCFRQSGNKVRSFNPTMYRSDALYESLIDAASAGGFTVEQRAASETYIQIKNNENQLMWLFRKDVDATTKAAAAAAAAPVSLTPAESLVDSSKCYVKNDEYGGART